MTFCVSFSILIEYVTVVTVYLNRVALSIFQQTTLLMFPTRLYWLQNRFYKSNNMYTDKTLCNKLSADECIIEVCCILITLNFLTYYQALVHRFETTLDRYKRVGLVGI